MGFWLAEQRQFVLQFMEIWSWYVAPGASYFHIIGTEELMVQQYKQSVE